MEVLKKQQNDVNEKLLNHFLFNIESNNTTNNYITTPIDTYNNKTLQYDCTKCSNKSFNYVVEEKLRHKYNHIDKNSELYSLNNNLAKTQEENTSFYSRLFNTNSSNMINVNEKLFFNNHSRLS